MRIHITKFYTQKNKNPREGKGMNRKHLLNILLIIILLIQYNCAPSMRSAKINPGFFADGVIMSNFNSVSATDEKGNDIHDESLEWDYTPLDLKIRYGWERTNNFGFELSLDLYATIGAYIELPSTNTFH